MTLAEAGEVQSDEIVIAPFMDVGLTPSFATIAGFASDVGSTISHGAVVDPSTAFMRRLVCTTQVQHSTLATSSS
jgi:hypothetical protein